MFESKSLKFKIVVSMLFLSFVTIFILSCISVWKSSSIIKDNAKQSFVLNAELAAEQVYTKFLEIERNIDLMGGSVVTATSVQSYADMAKLKNNQEAEYSKIRP